MGVDARKSFLPAPTDSSAVESTGSSLTPTDLATDISRRTDKTSHTVPDDGRPITIQTDKKGTSSRSRKISKSHHHSQASLLIEYFEGGKGEGLTTRPSVRVKVSPSTKRKAGEKVVDEVVVTEAHGSRKPSYRRHIPIGAESPKQTLEAGSVSSLSSLSETSRLANRGAPVDIELVRKEGSELSQNSASKDARFIVPPSDISSMPPDSMLEANPPPVARRHGRSRSASKEEVAEREESSPSTRRRSRSLSRERLTQKVLEKLANKPRDVPVSQQKRRREKGSSRRGSKDISDADGQSVGRMSSKQREFGSVTTGTESSLLTNSATAPNRKSGDQSSFLSGTSKSSVNNPKLLDAFEDVLRRVIIPELKELKKDKKVSGTRNKFESMLNQSDTSVSSASRGEGRRRVSQQNGTTDSKGRTSSGKESGGSRRSHRRQKEREPDSPSERNYRRRQSADSLSLDDGQSRRQSGKHHRVRNAAAGALVGGALTAAALDHHDSRSSMERRERRRQQSSSRSRSASVAESEEIFGKHGVPPMPMRSDVETDITRSSLLSDDASATPVRRVVHQVPQGSPKEVLSPHSTSTNSSVPSTPRKTPAGLRQGLGTHHGNFSHPDLSSYAEDAYEGQNTQSREAVPVGGPAILGAATMGPLMADEDRQRRYEANLHHQYPIRRGLSPIQSIASYNTSEPNRNSIMLARSSNSLTSLAKDHHAQRKLSFESLSSAPSPNLARSGRPEGINLETQSEILDQHENHAQSRAQKVDADTFFDEQRSENERYRDSYTSRGSNASSDPKVDHRRLTNFTDDNLESPYTDNLGSGQQVSRGHGTNPVYVHTPAGVESAVASLYDPSMASVPSTSSTVSQADSIERQKLANRRSETRAVHARDSGSPLKREYMHGDQYVQKRAGAQSPPRSVVLSEEERDLPQMGTSGVPIPSDPMPEIGVGLDSPQSEITTNPSVIHGPIGGTSPPGKRGHWPYGATPPRSEGRLASPTVEDRGLGITEPTAVMGTLGAGLGALGTRDGEATKAIPAAEGANYAPQAQQEYNQSRESYIENQSAMSPPKDEGYISAANAGTYSPDLKARDLGPLDTAGGRRKGKGLQDDPFTAQHDRHLNDTAKGIESIQSRDIVALMDHLTVRDAQRNARDTEILVTLVRSAAEMRNSFEDMKRFIAEQDDFVMDTADRQHQQTVQKVINGPRPQPLGSPRLPVRTQSDNEIDSPAKRQNVFKRALQGLSTKNTSELQNMESMLVRLLGEVAGLRASQDGQFINRRAQNNSFNSAENAREPTDAGYEPEGQAGTSSTVDRSGFFSHHSSRHTDPRGAAAGHRESANRVSTVIERDEDLHSVGSQELGGMDPQYGSERGSMGSGAASPEDTRGPRGVSLPLFTPPRNPGSENRTYSNEHTPQTSTDSKFRGKHKSTSSSLYPKMMSRWSKTTASSVFDNFRHSTQGASKSRPYSQVSHSGSNVGGQDYDHDPQDDTLRPTNTYLDDQYGDQENRPPSPLVPSQLSDDPKYHAHRNSMNLQHPQPRQGPTGRFQHHLENEAQTYMGEPFSPTSQTSNTWNQAKAQSHNNPHAQQRYSGYSGKERLSPISDGSFSETSSAMIQLGQEEHGNGPQRHLSGNSVSTTSRRRSQQDRWRDEEPLVPQRPAKIPVSPGEGRQANYVDHVHAARAGSPALDKSPMTALRFSPAGQATRKPSGPRPHPTSGQYSPGQPSTTKRARFQSNTPDNDGMM